MLPQQEKKDHLEEPQLLLLEEHYLLHGDQLGDEGLGPGFFRSGQQLVQKREVHLEAFKEVSVVFLGSGVSEVERKLVAALVLQDPRLEYYKVDVIQDEGDLALGEVKILYCRLVVCLFLSRDCFNEVSSLDQFLQFDE